MNKNDPWFSSNDFDAQTALADLLPGLPALGARSGWALDESSGTFGVFGSSDRSTGLSGITGSIRVGDREVGLSEFTRVSCSTQRTDGVPFTAITLESVREGLRWHWTIARKAHDTYLVATLENIGDRAVDLSEWCVVRATDGTGGTAFTRHPGETRIFRWNPWSMGVETLSETGAPQDSENLLHLYDPIDRSVLFCGFLTLSRMRARHEIRAASGGKALEYRAECLFGHFLLQPGRRFDSELVVIGFHDDPYLVLDHWADQMKAIYRPALHDLPPVGWNGNSWASNRPEKGAAWEPYAIRNARSVRKRLKGFDVDYLWTSQNNLKDYIPGNWLQVNRQEIPSGLARFFGRLKKLGFKPGLWVSPFWFHGEATELLEENRDNLLKDAAGNPICLEEAWGWKYDDDLPAYHRHMYFLDGTHPATLEHVRNLFRTYHRIGVEFYMLDFLGIVDGSRMHDPTKTPHQAGYSILKEIREVSGEDTHIQTAVSSSPGFAGTISAARIGRDFGEGRPLEGGTLSDWRNATHVLHDLHYANTKYFVMNSAANYFTHQKIYMNDLNSMTVDKPYPLEHARIVATMFGMNGGSPLMLGDDFLHLDEERLRLIKLCLPRTHHSARPVDLFERVRPGDHSRILKLEIRTEWDSYLLVAVFNLDDRPYPLTLDFAELGLAPDGKHVLFDFWNEEYLGIFHTSYPCLVPAGTCKLYRISTARPHPWLMSTDMHIQQGFVEVAGLEWNDAEMRLTGSVTRPVGEKGNLFILMPRQYVLVNSQDLRLVKELLDFHVIIKVPVDFRQTTERFELVFDRWRLERLAPKDLMPYSTREEWLAYMEANYHKESTRVFE